MQQTCIHCGDIYRGRTDKKYCSSSCRSSYHNKVNYKDLFPLKKINNLLKNNYKILNQLTYKNKPVKTSKENLVNAGFNFNYFTNTFPAKNGQTYFFCYDRGYLPLDNGLYSIVVKRELMN